MSNTQSIFELIDQCDFPKENPLELEEDIFVNLNSSLSPPLVKLITKKVYSDWLAYIFSSESEGIIFYRIMKDEISNLKEYYGHLPYEDIDQFDKSFEKIISDENKHRSMFLLFIKKIGLSSKIYKPEFYDPLVQEMIDTQFENWKKGTFIGALTQFITGECYFMTTFYTIYKNTLNPLKKQIFKELVKDESRHLVHFMKFLKKAKIPEHEKPIFHKLFINYALSQINFEQQNFKNVLSSLIKNETEKNLYYNLAYDTDFHHSFKKLFLKKSWQFYNVVFPDINQDMYESHLAMLQKNNT